jgi:PmbA protein
VENQRLADAVEAALRIGAVEAEALETTSRSFEVEVSRGEIETLASSSARGLGLRLFTSDKRMGFAYTASSDEPLETTVRNAWNNAISNDPEPYGNICRDAGVFDADWSEQAPADVPVEAKISFAKDLEKATLAADSRIVMVERAAYGDSLVDFALVNSAGVCRRYQNAYFSCSAGAVAAREGVDSESGWEFDVARTFDGLRLDWVAQRCAQDATRKLGGKPCATGAMPVVLDNAVATRFLAMFGSALRGDNVLKGKSLFAGSVGEAIASDCLTFVDQNDCPDAVGRAPFDAEGTLAKRTVLVENGRLQGYLHNQQTASEMGEKPTANAVRGFRSPPAVGPSSLYIVPGGVSQEGLFGKAPRGLFVTQALGMHSANLITGDFSFGASGLLFESGELRAPVRGVTIAGNFRPLLKAVEAVGNDLRFLGSCGAPSLLISELVVSGE